MIKTLLTAGLALICAAGPALADITVKDPYLRRVPPMAPTGAAFMTIENDGAPDRLIDVRSDVAERVELHTHIDAGDGVMQMRQDEDGFEIPGGGSHSLMRGGDHVMFLGFDAPIDAGETVSVTLVFETAGEVTVEIPLDNDRMPAAHGGMSHGAMDADGMTDADTMDSMDHDG